MKKDVCPQPTNHDAKDVMPSPLGMSVFSEEQEERHLFPFLDRFDSANSEGIRNSQLKPGHA